MEDMTNASQEYRVHRFVCVYLCLSLTFSVVSSFRLVLPCVRPLVVYSLVLSSLYFVLSCFASFYLFFSSLANLLFVSVESTHPSMYQPLYVCFCLDKTRQTRQSQDKTHGLSDVASSLFSSHICMIRFVCSASRPMSR